jgi:hypothetical protein
MSGEQTLRHSFSVRLRVSLSVGLVLGIGTTMTLASWQNPEYATGSFTTSTFVTESNVNGAGYASNTAAPGATVTFTGAGFTPSVIKYLSVLIQTKAGSLGGNVVLSGATLSGTNPATLGAAFQYKVVRTMSTCSAAAFTSTSTYVVGTAGTAASTYRALTTGQTTGVINTLAAATATVPGAAIGFCFAINLPANAANSLQGQSATATWQLGATSIG